MSREADTPRPDRGLRLRELFALGLAIGAITIPGNWTGRVLLRKMRDRDHRVIIDIMTVLMILNFVYLAAT